MSIVGDIFSGLGHPCKRLEDDFFSNYIMNGFKGFKISMEQSNEINKFIILVSGCIFIVFRKYYYIERKRYQTAAADHFLFQSAYPWTSIPVTR
jgi:hypothetical protein